MADSDLFAERLGDLLRQHRGDRRQVDVASAVGVSNTTYSDYERGLVLPSLPVLARLVIQLGISPAEIFALAEEPEPEPNGSEVAA